jgi:hypothetical protein
VGTFFTFLRTPLGYILFILIPFMLLIIYQGINCVKAFRSYKAEQMEQLEKEKAAIAAERKRSEAMMRKLQQMQRQMMQQQNPTPVQSKPSDDVDVDSLLAELAFLREQLDEKNNT